MRDYLCGICTRRGAISYRPRSAFVNPLGSVFGSLFFLFALLSINTCHGQTKAEAYKKINEVRIAHGVEPMVIDKKLARSAQSWAFFMPYSGRHNLNFIARRRAFKKQVEKEQIWGSEALAWGSDPVENWLKSYTHAGVVLGSKANRMGLGQWRGKWVLRTLIY